MTPSSSTIPSPIEVMMQRTKLPQLPSNIGKTAPHVQDAPIRQQGNITEVSYSILETGTPEWV